MTSLYNGQQWLGDVQQISEHEFDAITAQGEFIGSFASLRAARDALRKAGTTP